MPNTLHPTIAAALHPFTKGLQTMTTRPSDTELAELLHVAADWVGEAPARTGGAAYLKNATLQQIRAAAAALDTPAPAPQAPPAPERSPEAISAAYDRAEAASAVLRAARKYMATQDLFSPTYLDLSDAVTAYESLLTEGE